MARYAQDGVVQPAVDPVDAAVREQEERHERRRLTTPDQEHMSHERRRLTTHPTKNT